MKRPNKVSIALISIPIMLLLSFASNIYGYFRFQSYCSTDGGLRIYEKLEKNMGWWAKDKYDAKIVSQLKNVDFVRYTEKKDGNAYDLRFMGGNPNEEVSYQIAPADFSKELTYKWLSVYERLGENSRLDKFGQKIVRMSDDKILVTNYS